MADRQHISGRHANKWAGKFVCIALKDGSYYVGKVIEVRKGEFILDGVKGKRKLKGKKGLKGQVQVSGLFGTLISGFGMLRPFLGGGGLFRGGAGAATRSGGGLGFIGRIWPGIRIGFKMVKFIVPLFLK